MTTVDARGMRCPLPLAMAKVRMAELGAGEELLLLADDPEAVLDIGGWAEKEGHGLVVRDCEGWREFQLRKSSG